MLKSIGKLAGGGLVSGILSLLTLLIVLRFLTISEYGTLALIVSITAIAKRLINIQTEQIAIRYGSYLKEREEEEYKYFLSGLLFSEIFISILIFVVLLCIIEVFSEQFDWMTSAYSELQLYSLTTIFNLNAWAFGVLRVHGRFGFYGLIQFINPVFKLLGLASLFFYTSNIVLFDILVLWIISEVLTSIVAASISLWVFNFRQIVFGLRTVRAVFAERSYILDSVLDGWARTLKELDIQIVGAVLGESSAGVLKVVKQAIWVPQVIVEASNKYIFGELSRKKTMNEVKLMMRGSTLVGILVACCSVLIILTGDFFLTNLFEKEIAGITDYLVVAMIAPTIWGISHPLSGWLMANGRVRYLFKVHVIAGLVSIVMTIILAKSFELAGALWVLVIYQLFWVILCLPAYFKFRRIA